MTTPEELAALLQATAPADQAADEPIPVGIAIELHGVDRAACLYGRQTGMQAACDAFIAERAFSWVGVELDRVSL